MFHNNEIKSRFKRTDSLIRMKYLEYVPVLFITNLSTLLLVSVDGIVVGNFIGDIALEAVNMFVPIEVLFSAYIAIIAHGIADCFADAMVGDNPIERIYNGKATKFVIIISIIFLIIIQVPITHFMIHSYNLRTASKDLAITYALVMLVSMPFQLITSIGACQLEEIGAMKVLMHVSIIEGVTNLVLVILFVGTFKMGIFGAGLATTIACIVRALLTVIYFLTKTKIYKRYRVKLRMGDVKRIIVTGLPYSISIISSAIGGYFMLKLMIYLYGDSGGVVNGVFNFCLSIATVFITSSADANGPLNGIFLSYEDREAVDSALKIAARQIIIAVGVFTLLIVLRPDLFYHINGVSDIPEYGFEALKAYSLCFIFVGLNTLFQGYYVDKKEIKIMSRLTFFGDILTPLVAFLFYMYIDKKYFWYASFAVSCTVTIIYIIKYLVIAYKESKEEKEKGDILYLEVDPNEAAEASKELIQYANEKNYPSDVSHKLAVCLEEMVKYAVKSKDMIKIHIQIIINFFSYGAKFVMLDDGERLNLNKNNVEANVFNKDYVVNEDYEKIKKMAKSYSYQYVLNMNHITFEF